MWRTLQHMAKRVVRPPHYIRQWRQYRGLSLRQLTQRLEKEPGEDLLSASQLNRIENGEQPYYPELMAALAHAFDCEPEDILAINPLLKPELIDLMAVIRQLKKPQIVQATQILKAIA